VLDVVRGSLFDGADRQVLETPSSTYATLPFDRCTRRAVVGVSTPADTPSHRDWCSLAMIDGGDAEDGAEVTIVWGEVAAGARSSVVEQHAQTRSGHGQQPVARLIQGCWPPVCAVNSCECARSHSCRGSGEAGGVGQRNLDRNDLGDFWSCRWSFCPGEGFERGARVLDSSTGAGHRVPGYESTSMSRVHRDARPDVVSSTRR